MIREENLDDFVTGTVLKVKGAVEELRHQGVDCDMPDEISFAGPVVRQGGVNIITRRVNVTTGGTETVVEQAETEDDTTQHEERVNSGGTTSETDYTYESDA